MHDSLHHDLDRPSHRPISQGGVRGFGRAQPGNEVNPFNAQILGQQVGIGATGRVVLALSHQDHLGHSSGAGGQGGHYEQRLVDRAEPVWADD